jgi:hypothetical protein
LDTAKNKRPMISHRALQSAFHQVSRQRARRVRDSPKLIIGQTKHGLDYNPFCHGRLILHRLLPLARHLTAAQTLNVPALGAYK